MQNYHERRSRASDYFDVLFTKVYTFLVNKKCFESISSTIHIPVRDVDPYICSERLLKESEWMINLCKAFVEYQTHNL